MKFICDKCKTKYSIADSKVKGKVLKIRCKNCSNIITVREQKKGSGIHRRKKDSDLLGKSTGVLGRALDGAFKETQPITKGMQVAAVPDIAPEPSTGPLMSELTRLSDAPDFDEPPGEEEEWYLAVDGNQFGPMDLSELCNRIKRGETGPEAFVWHDGMDDWQDVADVAALQPHIPKHPPPPPRGKSGLLALNALAEDAVELRSPSANYPSVDALAAEAATSRHPSVEETPLAAPAALPREEPLGTGHLAADKELLDTVPRPKEEDELPPIVPVASIQPAATSVTSGTPVMMKLAAAGGIVAAVSGLILVVYFLFLDRKPTKLDAPQTKLAQVTPQAEKDETPDPADEKPASAAAVEIEFQPERITRTQPAKRPTRVASASKGAKKPSGPALTAEQKRMMAMFKKSGSNKIPGVNTARRASVKHRQISGSEVAGLYRKYKSSFQACYQRALKRDESLKELKVEVRIDISAMGRVRLVSFKSLPSQELKFCLRRIIKRWVFQPSGEQTIAIPLVFRGAG